jgi:hypothetical protein
MTPLAARGNDRPGNRLRPFVWGGAGLLLLLPAVAMQFTREVNWSAADFVAMGVLLTIACALYELGAWLSGDWVYRAAFGLAIATGFLTVWVNLAVGMLGDEHAAINLMFAGVLCIAAAGALFARFRAQGLAWAMFATATSQLAAVGVALPMGFAPHELALTAMFALPWSAAGLLFRFAARHRS